MSHSNETTSKERSVNSEELQDVRDRVLASELSTGDKAILKDILSQMIKLKVLVEQSTVSLGDKKVVASLPLGFDIVK